MSTAFFQQQDRARTNTFRLVVLFLLAVASLIVLTYFALLFAFNLTEGDETLKPGIWHPYIFLGVAGAVIAVVSGGSLYKIAELASGGKAVALLLGGQEISPTTRDFHQKRLLNIVEEMSIASGVPVPPVYLLPDENGINAFAAGHATSDAVVAVSQGSLDYLTRDELQGVVAHEFSHILNGDMRLNIRLLGLIHGIVVVSIVGLYLMSVASRSQSSSSDRNGRGGFFLVGLALYILGIAGAFFGQMIQAAVSRQREFLADASAVQFTRNPEGIGGALKKIGGLQEGSTVNHAGASEVSHMFFASGIAKSFSRMWDSHPPLADRIHQIDPQWDGVFPEVNLLNVEQERRTEREQKKPPLVGGMPSLPGLPQIPIPVLGLAGEAAPARVEPSEDLGMTETIPARVREAMQEAFSDRAVIYALLLDPNPPIRDKQLMLLQTNAEPRDVAETKRLEADVRSLPEEVKLTVAHLAMPALRQMSPAQYQVFRTQVEQLIAADKQVSLFEFCLKRVVIYHLDLAFSWRSKPRVRYRTLAPLVPAMGQVLGMLAWQGAAEESAVRKAYTAGFRAVLADAQFPDLPPRDAVSLDRFASALDQFIEAAPPIQQKLLEGCMACIMADGVVVPREQKLLMAICSTLNCRMPALPTH